MKTRREFLTTTGGVAGLLVSGVAATEKHAKRTVSLEQAQEVHQRVLIIDGHNDVTVERVARGEIPFRWHERDLAYHTDIPRMKETGYDAAFFIVGDGPIANVWITIENTLDQIKKHPED